jgi:predicted acylesterase/phospholipase RssA
MMITTEYIFKSQQFTLFSSKKWNRATLFKGMVINSLICAFKYRLFIYDILDKAGFDRNITLKKLYDICERKILLNFNCVNTLEQRFALINKIVKPNMPLWAALMASASLPYLEGELESRREWEMK